MARYFWYYSKLCFSLSIPFNSDFRLCIHSFHLAEDWNGECCRITNFQHCFHLIQEVEFIFIVSPALQTVGKNIVLLRLLVDGSSDAKCPFAPCTSTSSSASAPISISRRSSSAASSSPPSSGPELSLAVLMHTPLGRMIMSVSSLMLLGTSFAVIPPGRQAHPHPRAQTVSLTMMCIIHLDLTGHATTSAYQDISLS